MRYVSYVWHGYFHGWCIANFIPNVEVALQILEDAHKEGLSDCLMMLELEPPFPWRFWFKPRKAKRLFYVQPPR